MSDKVKVLPLTLGKGTFTFTQVWRDEHYAIYEQTDHRNPTFKRYEAFAIPVQKEAVNTGNFIVAAGEHYPGMSAWGVSAFTLFSLDAAKRKIEALKNSKSLSTDKQ